MPVRSDAVSSASAISPPPAWTRTLRPTSEIAVAIRVASVREKPSRAASARPSARATTMSASPAIATEISSAIAAASSPEAVEQCEGLVEVQRRLQRVEVEPELHHGHRDVRLDPDDHRRRAAKASHKCDRAQRARDEGVDDVQRRHVDDDAPRAVTTDVIGEIVAKLQHLAVRESRLDRRDQVTAVFEDRYRHSAVPRAPDPGSGLPPPGSP